MGQSTTNATLLLKCCTVVEMLLKEMKEWPRPVDTKENNELLLPYEEGNRKEVCEYLSMASGAHISRKIDITIVDVDHCQIFWPPIAVEGKFQ